MKTHLTWNDLMERTAVAVDIARGMVNKEGEEKTLYVWGIPKGGSIVAGLLFAKFPNVEVCHHPEEADILVDDIYDSGATMRYYTGKYRKSAVAVVDKRSDLDKDLGWVVFPWEAQKDNETCEDNITRILQYLGEDVQREGLEETPKRVIKSYKSLYSGYTDDPKNHMKVFKDDACDEMVLASFEFYSMCEHHMLPFFGTAHVAYIPNGKVIGVSKLSRIFDVYARRLQIQDRIGQQVCDALHEGLSPLGVACYIEAQHMCMTMRGVQKQSAMMKTSCVRGVFKSKPEARKEFFDLIS